MNTVVPNIEHNATGFRNAIEQSNSMGFGFFDDFAPVLFEPIEESIDKISIGFFEDVNHESPMTIPEVMVLRSLFLVYTQAVDPKSNLGYGHVFRRSNGGVIGHRDINPEKLCDGGYRMGKYRVSLNVKGPTTIFYDPPLGERKEREIKPGDGYVINLVHNPWHASKATGRVEINSSVLLMTDVAERVTESTSTTQ